MRLTTNPLPGKNEKLNQIAAAYKLNNLYSELGGKIQSKDLMNVYSEYQNESHEQAFSGYSEQ